MKNLILQFKNDKRGASLLWELMIVLFILFSFLWSSISFFAVFVQYETLTYAAKTVARQIEVTGDYSDATVGTNVNALLGGTDLKNVSYTIDVGELSTDVPTSAALATQLQNEKHLQLSQKFTIKYTADYDLKIITSADTKLAKLLTMEIPLSYKVTGMSEVYFRES